MAKAVKRGELWLVRLDPAEGHEMQKTRPALILQNDASNEHSSVTIIAPLTTQGIERCYPNEAIITATAASLPRTSKVLLNHLRSVDQRRLLKRLGRITAVEQHHVDEALSISLGLVPLE